MLFSWFWRGLRTGVLTTRYPNVHEEMPEGFRGRPILDAERCLADRGCDACTQICLPSALSRKSFAFEDEGNRQQEGQQLMLDYTRCILCGLCVTACPEDALHMTQEYELAARTREDLRSVFLFVPSAHEGIEERGVDNGRPA